MAKAPNPRPAPPPGKGRRPRALDAIDHQILRLLMRNGRMSNAAVAAATATAESTSHARIQALVDSGVIRGFHAEVDAAAIGRPLLALISVRIHPGMRDGLEQQAQRLLKSPCVVHVFFTSGQSDLVIWVAVPDSQALRDFVLTDLNGHKEIAGTETNVVLQHWRGEVDTVS
ncbi:Lrp/AsnC family transcriptional regulator [Raineyella fluvialis]|uniref:AsnC family transcriptional regulator n=1 Tax=Raineyella fluvialis TaxID=2662261 RepID=A0A5Q2FD16_9ACTN|nr:Lrp/AsnC family transcriptional regulator [Raineyella fluvialis]QGF23667.1 AsnC family transcriptional regulator [Raineyella fluvialis]